MLKRNDHDLPYEHGTEQLPLHLGAFLKMLRDRHGIKQSAILEKLPTASLWTQPMYSDIERGKTAPPFKQLQIIYKALYDAGVRFSAQDRQQFILLAQSRLERKKTHKAHAQATMADWQALRLNLIEIEQGSATENSSRVSPRPFPKPRMTDTRNLVGREDWLASIADIVRGPQPEKKILIMQGPVGIGKTSELHRIAMSVVRANLRHQVVLCTLPAMEQSIGPESALERFLSDILAEVAPSDVAIPQTSLNIRISFVLGSLEKMVTPTLLLLDNAEHMLDERGELATCWEQFLAKFLRCQHFASLIVATEEWRGWFEGEKLFVKKVLVPPLSPAAAVMFLQNMGLESVSVEQLYRVNDLVGGIPLCLKWVASLIQDPLSLDSWDGVDLDQQIEENDADLPHLDTKSQQVKRLLSDPSLVVGSVTTKLRPLLQRVLDQHLSSDGRQVLHVLSLATIPLGQRALQEFCSRPSLLKELRDASLLAAYSQRIQILPMVAASVKQGLTQEQLWRAEQQLINAYIAWLRQGMISEREAGSVVAELVVLLLKHLQLLNTAQILIRYGWLAFNHGHTKRITHFAYDSIEQKVWERTEENICGSILLDHFLAPYHGRKRDDQRCEREYTHVLSQIRAETIHAEPSIEVHMILHLLVSMTNGGRFEEAQGLLEQSFQRLSPLFPHDTNLHAAMLDRRALLLGKWSDWAKKHGEEEKAQNLFHQTLCIYQQCADILSVENEPIPPLEEGIRKKRLARILNGLGYRLNLIGQFEQALKVIEQSIILKERGFTEFGALAASFGEKAQSLAQLGRYSEALHFSDKAIAEVQRLARAGDSSSDEEQWIYLIERAKVLWQLARPDEAERLIVEAQPKLSLRRRDTFGMIAEQITTNIKQWRQTTTTTQCQLDWRWIDEFRELVSFPIYDWLKPSGPLTSGEEQQIGLLKSQGTDESLQQQNVIYARALERETSVALQEHRDPRWFYPNIPIDTVHTLMAKLRNLRVRVQLHEINALVKELYQQSIDEHLIILSLAEATYFRDNARYWENVGQLYPEPTYEEEQYALTRIRWVLLQGASRDGTRGLVQQVCQLLAEYQITFDLTLQPGEQETITGEKPLSPQQAPCMVKASTAKRFLEMMLARRGYDGWQVIIDPSARSHYADSATRRLTLLPNEKGMIPAQQVLSIDNHEVQDHVRSSVAGDFSRLGLLGIGLPNYGPAREGCALYRQRATAEHEGKSFDESAIWVGTFAIMLASRTSEYPQAFYRLYQCLERFFLLYRLVKRPDQDYAVAEQKAQELALGRCLRLFRGKPDFNGKGCWTKDILYQRGLHLVELAVAKDPSVLAYLDLGKMALEHIPLLRELQILSVSVETTDKVLPEGDLEALLLSLDQE